MIVVWLMLLWVYFLDVQVEVVLMLLMLPVLGLVLPVVVGVRSLFFGACWWWLPGCA